MIKLNKNNGTENDNIYKYNGTENDNTYFILHISY